MIILNRTVLWFYIVLPSLDWFFPGEVFLGPPGRGIVMTGWSDTEVRILCLKSEPKIQISIKLFSNVFNLDNRIVRLGLTIEMELPLDIDTTLRF